MTLSNRIRVTNGNQSPSRQRFVTLDGSGFTGSWPVALARPVDLSRKVTDVARILIVDDDRSIRRTLEKFLGSEGYEVATAMDAPGAVASTNESVDLMLLDLGLPGGSGFDVLTALADRPYAPTVVVVTARDDMQSTVKAIQLGAYEYLVKPVDIERLRHVVKRALESRETRAQLEEFV